MWGVERGKGVPEDPPATGEAALSGQTLGRGLGLLGCHDHLGHQMIAEAETWVPTQEAEQGDG